MSGITVACLDMAGTTVADEGSVMSAFRAAMEQAGLPRGTDRYDRAADIVQATVNVMPATTPTTTAAALAPWM